MHGTAGTGKSIAVEGKPSKTCATAEVIAW
jgi:hypothetical protein